MFAVTSGPGNQVGPLANVNVRRAIAYAIPYTSILKNIVHGRGARDYSIVSPTAPEYAAAWSKYTTNLAKARRDEGCRQPVDHRAAVLPELGRRPDQHGAADPGEPEGDRHRRNAHPRDPG